MVTADLPKSGSQEQRLRPQEEGKLPGHSEFSSPQFMVQTELWGFLGAGQRVDL